MEKRQAARDAARDEWWMVEIEAMRAELKETVEEVKTRNNDVMEILKAVRGVQESLKSANRDVPHMLGNENPKFSLPTTDTSGSLILSPVHQSAEFQRPVQETQSLPRPIVECQVADDPISTTETGITTYNLPDVIVGIKGETSKIPTTRGRKRALSPTFPGWDPSRPTPAPRPSLHPLPYSTPVMILHPDYSRPVAYGKAGASWKMKTGRLGGLCEPGQQMVQVNQVAVANVSLLHLESRHSARTLEGALNPYPMPSKQKVLYVKWNTSHLIRI